METDNKHKYYAFISYKREDEEWAKWLQHKLEHYKLPSNLNGRTDLPKEIRPVFKDTSELNPGNLPQQIHNALEQSKYLIVICSPRSAQSEWVNKEVETFMGMGKTDKIIPFIIDGKAFAKNPEEECFPEAIRNLPAEQELLGANIGEMGRDAAAVKAVAQMFGLKFDELWQRHEREQRKKRNWIITASIMGFFIMAGVALWMYAQRQETLKANWKMMENQSRFVAEKATNLLGDNSILASLLAIEVLPTDLNHPNRPYTVEAEKALRNSVATNTTVLQGHTGAIHSVVFSPDGKKIASASSDKTIRIWDAENGQTLQTIIGHTDAVYCVAFSPDGEKLVSGSNDKTIRIWDVETGEELRTINGHNNRVFYIEWSGEHLFSGSIDGTIRAWNADTGEEIGRKDVKTNSYILPEAFSSDNKRYAFLDNERTVSVIDYENGDKLFSLTGHTELITKITFSPNNKQIATASEDKTIRLWDAETGMEQIILRGHNLSPLCISYSPDGKRIVSGSIDKTVRIWDLAATKHSEKETLTITYPDESFVALIPSPDLKRIVTTSYEGTVRIWNMETQQEMPNLEGYDNGFTYATFSQDGTQIVAASTNATIYIWDIETCRVLHVLEGHSDEVYYAAFSPDDKYIVSASGDQTVRVWNAKTGEELHNLTGYSDVVFFATFSPNGKQIATLSFDNLIRIWNAETGNLIHNIQFEEPNCMLTSLSFSPDGKHLAATVVNGDNCIWNLQTGTMIKKLERNSSMDFSIKYSPDSKYITTASLDSIVSVWDTDSGQIIETFLSAETEDFTYVTFDASGQQIVVTTSNGKLQIYDFPPLQELIDQTRERFKDRPLTPEERKMYYLE